MPQAVLNKKPRRNAALSSQAAEHRAAEANENTRAVLQVIDALSRVKDADEAIRVALDTVKAAFGWAYGSFWKLDPAERALRFALESGSVNEEFGRVTQSASFRTAPPGRRVFDHQRNQLLPRSAPL